MGRRNEKPKAYAHSDYLSLIGKTKNKGKRSMLIDYANKEQIEAIAECIDNILRGNVPLNKNEAKKLKKHKNTMRTVTDRHTPIRRKKDVLRQQGGFLSTLIPIAISALGSLVSGFMNKA